MDHESLRAILRSSGRFMETLTEEKDLDKLLEKIPICDKNTSSALSASLTDLMTYKVTPDAYQRYSVRIKIIETIREWVKPPFGLSAFQTFYQSKNILQLCQRMMTKYFSNANFDNITSSENFLIFGRELITIACRDPLYIPYVKLLMEKICNSDLPFDIHELVESVLDYEEQFKLEILLVEKLYIMNCTKLIEEPLIDCFLNNLKCKNSESFTVTNSFNRLMRFTVKSMKIFQIISSILKVLFVRLEYSSLVLNYIQFVLKNVKLNRQDNRMCIIDLYPIELQSHVILLNINPRYHSENSKKFVLQILKKIYLYNPHKVLTLLTHFPEWLDPFKNYVEDLIAY